MCAVSVPRSVALLVLATALTGLAPATGRAQSFQYPPYGAQRGHMVSRNGLFHVTRYHWGNGLTPAGAAFLTDAVDTIVPAIPGIIAAATGREVDNQTRDAQSRSLATRTPVQFTAPQDYVDEQRRANDLLARTASLVGVSSVAPPPVAAPGGGPTADQPSVDELLKRYGAPSSNPWKQ